MEVLAFLLILCFRVITITAHGNTLPLTTATSQIESIKVLPPDKEALILNNFPINELDFLKSPNLPNACPEVENGLATDMILAAPGLANSEIFLESAASAFPPSLPNFFLNFEGNSAVKDFTPPISHPVRSSTFGCHSFTNDISGAICMSNFKALRDSIEAYANFISSSNSVFNLPMGIQSSGGSISKPCDLPSDLFTTPVIFEEPQPPCVQPIDTINPHLSFLSFTDSCPSLSQNMFPAFDSPRAIETCGSPLVSHNSDFITHAPCVKSFDTLNPDFRLVSDSCQSYSQSMLPLLDFPRYIETSQSPLVSSSQDLLRVFDVPIENRQFSTLSQYNSPINCLPTVSSLSTVNLSPKFGKFDSFPSFSSSSAFSLPITVTCIDCKPCSLCPLPTYSPTFSILPVQKIIEDCIVSTPNTLAPPILPMSSFYSSCSSPLTISMYSAPVFDPFPTDDLNSKNCPNVSTTSSLPLSTDLGSCMISVKNLLPSLSGKKSISHSLSPVSLALPSGLPKLSLATTPFSPLPKSPISLFNNSFFEIPDLSGGVSDFDNTMFQSVATPISSTHVFPNLSLPSTNIFKPNPLTSSFSCLTASSMVPILSSSSSNYIPSTTIDLPPCYKEPNSYNISSIVSDQTVSNTCSLVPFPKTFDSIPKKELVPEPNVFLSDRK